MHPDLLTLHIFGRLNHIGLGVRLGGEEAFSFCFEKQDLGRTSAKPRHRKGIAPLNALKEEEGNFVRRIVDLCPETG